MFFHYRFFSYYLLLCIGAAHAMEHVPDAFKDLPGGVSAYINSLPKIKNFPDQNNIEKQGEVITDYLLEMGGYSNKDIPGKNELRTKVVDAIKNQRPIIRCIPAFPVSSANENKIPFDDAHAFSMGDLVALLTQNHVSGEIGKVHKKGSALHIYWEPWVYDLNKITTDKLGTPEYPQTRIDSYQATLTDLVGYFKPNIELGIPNRGDMESLYKAKYAEFPVTVDLIKKQQYKFFFEGDLDSATWKDRVERKLFEAAEGQQLVAKLPKNMRNMSFEELKKENAYTKKVKQHLNIKKHFKDAADELAEAAIRGSQREALLMKNEIPNFDQKIRVTVRPDRATVQDKIGTPMIYNSDGMPWHNVLVVSDTDVKLDAFKNLNKTTEVYRYKQYEYQLKQYTVGKHDLSYFYETQKERST